MFKSFYYLLIISFINGAIAVLAFAPFAYYPVLLFSNGLLFFLLQRSSCQQAFWIGYCYALGLMGFGVFWLRISFDEFNHLGLFLSTFLVFGFIFAISFYFAFIALFARFLAQKGGVARQLLIISLVWVLGEGFRSWFLTGFPWLTSGYAFIDSPLAGFAPILGVYGVSLAGALSVVLLLYFILKVKPQLSISLFILLWLGAGLLLSFEWTTKQSKSLTIALFQANISQQLKWQPQQLMPTLKMHMQATHENADVDLMIWAETAIPILAKRIETTFLSPLEKQLKAQQRGVLTGIPIIEESQLFNALLLIGESQRQIYKKHHLVPFGEYQPIAFIQPIIDYFGIPMSNFSQGEQGSSILRFKGFNLGVSICYEDVFSRQIRQAMPQADILINVSNDAWFGDSIAPYQHLQMARMRALENGRYFIRATNTGISAIMNEKGNVIEVMPLSKKGVLNQTIPQITGLTPFARYGETPFWLLLILSLIFVYFKPIKTSFENSLIYKS